MVNYCCVAGCGRNSRLNKHLNYYSLPKERHRQEEWLKAAGREDLLGKGCGKLAVSHRFCSRHFAPASVKNRNLCANAVPTLYLPGYLSEDDESEIDHVHRDVVCDSCGEPVAGFRYKCVTCHDYDLCQKCEMNETHAQHFMIRIPKPVNFKQADNLVTKWREFYLSNHSTPDCMATDSDSSEDMPITRYKKKDHSDIPEDVKLRIQKEIARVLNLNMDTDEKLNVSSLKRTNESAQFSSKKMKSETDVQISEKGIEVVFADVNNVNSPFMGLHN